MTSTATSENRDLAGKGHWDATERNRHIELRAFGPDAGVRGYAKRAWHQSFERAFGNAGTPGKSLLELGCGGSAFLPYFARHFGFDVHGVDFSESGCELAREMCKAHDVEATIVCADFFAPPAELIGIFDVVVSFGVVEHFANTAHTLASFARFLRPGGTLLTVVPNMSGMPGAAQKLLSRSVYDVHEVITPERLARAHESAGFSVVENDYFLFLNFGVVNPGEPATLAKRTAMTLLRGVTGLAWSIERTFGALSANRFTSPYVWCVARLNE